MRRLLPAWRTRAVQATGVLAGAGHVVILAGMALFTAIVVVLFLSAFQMDDVSWTVRLAVTGVAALCVVRPGAGLLVVAGLVAVSEIVGAFAGSRVRNAELLVLSGLCGALLRGWWTGAVRRLPASRLETAALVLGLVTAASCIEQFWFLQIQRDFPEPFLRGLWAYVRTDYLVGPSSYGGALGSAMLLLEGLALVVWAARVSGTRQPDAPAPVMHVIALGGVVTALLTLWYVATEFSESGRPISAIASFVWSNRWAIHVLDVNAAAAYFGLALFLVAGRALAPGRFRGFWMGGSLLLATALLLTRSRTTIVLVTLVGVVALVRAAARRGWWRRLAPAAVLLAALATASVLSRGTPRGGADVALDVRWGFLGTTAGMLAWQPLSGVGIGQFTLWSQHFSSPELLALYRIENAHNNFAQVAGELGLPGLVALLGLLVVALTRWHRATAMSGVGRMDVLALLAFVATWLGNHPMLLPAVAFPFWIALGAARDPDTDATPAGAPASAVLARPRSYATVIALVMAALVMSLPLRVAGKSETLNWPRISYGFHEWEGEGERRTRWMSRRARFYLPPEVTRFRLPVRALVSDEDPIALDLLIDGQPASRVEMDDWDVRTVEMALPGRSRGSAWQIDLVASRSWVPAEVSPDSQDTRELSVMVWPIELFDRTNAVIRTEPEAPVVQEPPRRRLRLRRSAETPVPESRQENRDRPTRNRD